MPAACSLAIHVALNEMQQEVELINVRTQEENQREQFLKHNKRGQVPTLLDDQLVIREGAAILLYLIEKHKSNLLPQNSADRACALEWLMFANSTLHPTYSRVFFALRSLKDKSVQDQVLQPTIERINSLWQEVDDKLKTTKYIAGNQITIADILLAVIANWGFGMFFHQIKLGENLKRMIKDVISRKSFQDALKREGAEYKAV